MRKPLGMLFDYGETILTTRKFDSLAGNRRLLELAESHHEMTPEEIQAVADELNAEVNAIRIESMIEFGVQSFHKLLYEHLGITFNATPLEMEREFWLGAVNNEPTEGIYELLDKLDEMGIKTGIVSNTAWTGEVMMEDLIKFDLAHRFSFLIASADYGFRKPHTRIFKLAAAKLGLEPEDIWFAGDMPEYDIKGALDSGMFPVWYNPKKVPGGIEGDYLEINSWYELIDTLDSL